MHSLNNCEEHPRSSCPQKTRSLPSKNYSEGRRQTINRKVSHVNTDREQGFEGNKAERESDGGGWGGMEACGGGEGAKSRKG